MITNDAETTVYSVTPQSFLKLAEEKWTGQKAYILLNPKSGLHTVFNTLDEAVDLIEERKSKDLFADLWCYKGVAFTIRPTAPHMFTDILAVVPKLDMPAACFRSPFGTITVVLGEETECSRSNTNQQVGTQDLSTPVDTPEPESSSTNEDTVTYPDDECPLD